MVVQRKCFHNATVPGRYAEQHCELHTGGSLCTRRNAEEIHGVAFRRNPIDVHGSKQFGEYSYCVARPNVLHGRTTGRKLRQAAVRLFRVRYRSKKGRSCAEKAIRDCEPAANLPRVRPGRYRIMHKKAGKESDSSRFCLYLFHNDQIKIDMEKLLEQINDRIAAFQKDAYLQ